jgi:hypothetical protein
MTANQLSAEDSDSRIDTADHTIDDLIQLWFAGEIGVDDGCVRGGVESIEVIFEGEDGELTIPYTLSEDCVTRTDENGMFDIVYRAEEVEP